jgi:hypothetical protein
MSNDDKGRVLILQEDVENPRPDRRKKRDGWAVPVFKKGTVFVEQGIYILDEVRSKAIKPAKGYGRFLTWRFAQEEHNLYPGNFKTKEATTWADVAKEEGDWDHLAGDVLEKLIRTEAVSLDEVRSALRWVLDHDDA